MKLLLTASAAAVLLSAPAMAGKVWPSLDDDIYRRNLVPLQMAGNYGDGQTHSDQGERGPGGGPDGYGPSGNVQCCGSVSWALQETKQALARHRGGDDGHDVTSSSNDSLAGGGCCSSDQLDD